MNLNTGKQKLADTLMDRGRVGGGPRVGLSQPRLCQLTSAGHQPPPHAADQLGPPSVLAVGLVLEHSDTAREREQTLRITDCFRCRQKVGR